MSNKSIIFDTSTLQNAVHALCQLIGTVQVFAFYGPLGVGKTTVIKHMLGELGVTDVVISPTFNYMNIYSNAQGTQFIHFDLYRIKSIEQFMQAGFNEYLYQPNVIVFIEWPEIIENLLSPNTCFVRISYGLDGQRKLEFETI